MKSIETVYASLQEKKAALKNIQSVYKDSLLHDSQYTELQEQLKELRILKKSIEQAVQDSMGSDYGKIEQLKADIADEKELLSDIVMSKVMAGESVTFTDEYNTEYEPKFSVRFTKIH